MKISILTASPSGSPWPFDFDDSNWQTWSGWDFNIKCFNWTVDRRTAYIPDDATSIFRAYNLLSENPAGDILCFLHDDARVLSKIWVSKIGDFFPRHPEAGVVGLVGSDRMVPNPLYPLLYANGEEHYYGKLIQGNVTKEFQPVITVSTWKRFHLPGLYKEVVAVDGFCFFIRKEVLEKVGGFDEKTYDRDGPCFHMYDIDLCFEARKAGYKNYVIGGILAQHLSLGKLDEGWHKARKIFIEKWGEKEIIIQ